MNITENWYYENIKRALGIISVVLCIGLGTIILLTVFQNKQYKELVVSGVNIYKSTNNFLNIVSEQENIMNAYYNGENVEITEYGMESMYTNAQKAVSALKKDIAFMNNDYVMSRYNDLTVQYNILENNIKTISNKILNGKKTDKSEHYYLISIPVNSIRYICGDILIVTSEINEQNIKAGNSITGIALFINVIMAAVIISTLVYSFKVIQKNGQQMADEQLKSKREAVENMGKACTDNLTGLLNRKYLEQFVDHVIERKETGCLYMLDLDNFKKVNDTYGHMAGDKVLKQFAKILKNAVRDEDVCCRLGGDEFSIFASSTRIDYANILANRIIEDSKNRLKEVEGGHLISVSIGIAELSSNMHAFQDIYTKADDALYYVKKNGKSGYHINY